MRIVLVGVGALGSHLTLLLRNLDVDLVLIDFDRVEQKNTQSQFHGRPSVRKSKIQSLAQTMQFLFGRKVEGIPHRLTSDNVDTLLGQADLVVDCLDNAESRALVQKFVRGHSIPCLHGGLATDGTFGVSLWDEDFQIDEEDAQGQATCENGDFLPFISLVSSYMALSVQYFVRDNRKVGFNVGLRGARAV